jgi:formylglycine-generating enzyme required for sulfatase activity
MLAGSVLRRHAGSAWHRVWLLLVTLGSVGTLRASSPDAPALEVSTTAVSDARAIVSNWPSANIETGFMNRAVLQPGNRVNFKWGNEMRSVSKDNQVEMLVPQEVAVAPPPPPRGMLMIPGCQFVMGSGVLVPGSSVPARTINSFFIDAYEVPGCVWTDIRRWAVIHGYTDLAEGQDGSRSDGNAAGSDHPVVKVTWYDCLKWCNARSEKENLVPVYYVNSIQKNVYRTGRLDLLEMCVDWTANGYRLPTEAEWERAARGGVSGQLYPWGDKLDHTRANYWNGATTNRSGTTPIGTFSGRASEREGSKTVISDANGFGMHDVAGNVYEWCWDWFGPYSVTNSFGPVSGTYRVIRGGCWASVVDMNLSCGYRNAMRPAQASPHVGFRCVRRH